MRNLAAKIRGWFTRTPGTWAFTIRHADGQRTTFRGFATEAAAIREAATADFPLDGPVVIIIHQGEYEE